MMVSAGRLLKNRQRFVEGLPALPNATYMHVAIRQLIDQLTDKREFYNSLKVLMVGA